MGQKNQLWWDPPAGESFRLHQQIYRIEPAEYQKTLDELCELLDIGRLLKQPVRELSLGERMKMELNRRVATFARSPLSRRTNDRPRCRCATSHSAVPEKLPEQRQITVLTSHYMKDVAALCKRVVIIAQGEIKYDGSLSGIVDRFSGQSWITLQLVGDESEKGLEQFGRIVSASNCRK